MRKTLVFSLCLLLLLGAAHGCARAEFVFTEGAMTQPVEGTASEPAGAASGDAESGGMVFTTTVSEEEPAPVDDGPVEILITAAGDVTLGGNMRKNPASTMYTKLLDKKEGDLAFFFANVLEYFQQDDMTLVNFEGTLTEATRHKENNEFIFRAPPAHVQMLTLGSVEAVAFENNHVMDFLEQGHSDTIAAFEQAGIVYATEASMGVYEVKGVSIALLAYQTFNNAYPRLHEEMPLAVAAAKAAHDIVIVSYHWGDEGEFKPNSRQVELGRATIDAGADLVLGHHSHRINPIEEYNGRYIVYSLGNCSFSGNTKPSNMDTFLFQQKFLVKGGVAVSGDFRIIPCSISSVSAASDAASAENDLAVTPFAPGGKGAQRVVDTMLENGKSLEYAVTSYPTEWE